MRPILSWLILVDDRIREKAIGIAPEICLQGGDPSELPIELRIHFLEKFCAQYAKQNRWGFSFDLSELRRFASPGLAETINGLLATYCSHEKIQELLFQMIWQGEIQDCVETAMQIILNNSSAIPGRTYGIFAIESIGSAAQKKRFVSSILADSTMKNREVVAALISGFAPTELQTQDVLKLIKRVDRPDEDSYSRLEADLEDYCLKTCPEEALFLWCQGLLALLKQPSINTIHRSEVSNAYRWLLKFSALSVERLIRIQHPRASDQSTMEIIYYIQNDQLYDGYHVRDRLLAELIPKYSDVNHALFWFDVEATRKYKYQKDGKRLIALREVFFSRHYWKFTKDDFENILKDIYLRPKLDDRLVALSLAFRLYKEVDQGRIRRQALKKAVNDKPELRDALHHLLNPPRLSKEIKRQRRLESNFEQQEKRRDKVLTQVKEKNREWIQNNIDSIRDTSIAASGKVRQAQGYLLGVLLEKKSLSENWASPQWEDLIPEFGQGVAEAYRDRCLDYWRKYCPKTRSEGLKNPNSIPRAVTIGLSGLEIESKYITGWPNNLSEENAKFACRYAYNGLNSFPGWFSRLHTTFPDLVIAMLLKEISWEFSQYDGNDPCHHVLSKVAHGADGLKHKIANPILALLRNSEPKHDSTVKEHVIW